MTPAELKSLLARFRIRPSHRLGQNFLLSEEVLDQITAAADLTKTDTVLEIGPGLGFLTKRLAEKAGRVVAIEKDRKLARALRKLMAKRQHVEIVEGDALWFPERQATSDWRLGNSNRQSLIANRHKVVANIPYYLTGKLLEKFLSPSSVSLRGAERRSNPEEIATPTTKVGARNDKVGRPILLVLLLQKEVAERIVAGPGQMSILSVSVQFYAEPEIIAEVPKENFYPMPEVDSAIVRLTPLSSPLSKGGQRGVRLNVDEKKFFQLVKIGFANKRKQLQNNLRALATSDVRLATRRERSKSPIANRQSLSGLPTTDYKQVLQELGLNPQARAQDLSLEEWGRLYARLYKS